MRMKDLIDTQWNVNQTICCLSVVGSGFNRYIVECKLSAFIDGISVAWDLIDTQWNVNKVIRGSTHLVNPDLIDTQWNVNPATPPIIVEVHADLIDTQWNVNTISQRRKHQLKKI